jgi:hypothetical protein
MAMHSRISAFLLASVLGLAAMAVQAAELLMIEEDGCIWCARWNSEIGPIYPMTLEGKAAPLRRVDIRDAPPPGISLKSPAVFTPTFVLIENGAEIGRIEGYPGEDFFWGLLGVLLRQLPRNTVPEVTGL